jgi:osmotically-inducible protein OsmY
MKPVFFVYIGILLFLSGCPAVCLVGAGGGAGYTAGEVAADKDRGVGDVLSDGAITVKVNAAFAADKKLSMWDVDVDTRLGVVTLRGYIKSKEAIEEAIDTAKAVEGVKKVKSLLVVDKGDK